MQLKPLDTVGIVGGGQLGRMLAMAAGRLGFKTAILDPQEDAPAFQFADTKVVAAYDDLAGLKALAEKCDVLTYEFENVPVGTLKEISGQISVYPGVRALETSQDRLVEKSFFHDLGIATAPFFDVTDKDSLHSALKSTNGEGILKTRHLGYDGKGQIRLSPGDDNAIDAALELAGNTPCILEGFVGFDREISIIAARATDKSVLCFEPAENIHREGILRTSTVPANISRVTAKTAIELAKSILSSLDYVGTIGIEFFVMNDGKLLANEFAPRVHNSGHWTEAACTVSQFEQHIRAVAGLPLAETARHSDCRMENLIGHDMEKVPDLLKESNTYLHLYGKSETRAGRKMGHFTRISPIQA